MNRIFVRMQSLMAIVAVSFAMFAVSCSDDNPVDNNGANEAELLVNYVESTSDYVNVKAPAITTAEALKGLAPTKTYILDIRSADAFATGHIEGAVNVPEFKDLVSHVAGINASNYDDIVIVCYSGQTAAYGASLLRMLGYDNVSSLKFGMSSWHSDFAGSWKNSAGNAWKTEFVTDATPMPTETYSYPTLTTGYTTGEAILEARVNELLTEGFGPAGITSDKVFANLDDYFIVNYWNNDHYTNIGHIPGAYQYTPKQDFHSSAKLMNLPTDKPIVVYCYTGQTSAAVAAYLRAIGYDAYTLKFGTSGMCNDLTTQHGATHWDDKYVMDYPYVTD